MSESPYTDAILDYLADQEPHTIAEIREGILAHESFNVGQSIRGLMWRLAEKQDGRKIITGTRERRSTYQLVARFRHKPLEIPVE